MKSTASSRLGEISSEMMPRRKPCAGSGSPAARLAKAPAAAAPLKRSRRVSCIAAAPLKVYLKDGMGGEMLWTWALALPYGRSQLAARDGCFTFGAETGD